MELNKIYNEDCLIGLKRLPDASVDCVLTDPPYLYLKNQKLDRPFDEVAFFAEIKRVLKPKGFVVLFGRGTSFYRWNTRLADLGFEFKEEVVWNKVRISSPLLPISRIHETISIHTLGGSINKVKVPYLEMKGHDIDSICQDIKRVRSVLNNTKSLNNVLAYLEDNKKFLDIDVVDKYNVSIQSGVKQIDRAAATVNSIRSGMSEKSIIRESRDHYKTNHPTQKPVRLLERLLALVTKEGDVVLDPFAGSCSTAIACVNTNRKYIGYEIDDEYYELGTERLEKILSEPKLAI